MVVWEGSIEALGKVMKKAENQQLMRCRMLAKPGTWPPGLQHGWGQLMVTTLCSCPVACGYTGSCYIA